MKVFPYMLKTLIVVIFLELVSKQLNYNIFGVAGSYSQW